ncbi:MAG: TIGR03032 family protein [Hyphomicrobiaceae bacterium]
MSQTQSMEEKFVFSTSRGFASWLARSGGSIAFTTYQAGKIFFIGLRRTGEHTVHERTFARCMGLAVSDDRRTLMLATHYQIYRFDNVLPQGQATPNGEDALYVPRQAWITGDLDAHDVAFGADGRPILVNTAFGCLATVTDGSSFKPIWKPPFISRIAPEDRCHLNGMAVENGMPRYVTAVSTSDVVDGWRDRRAGGGVVVDVQTNEIVCEGLSMPHSPRLHDGRLWLLNSGAGEFGYVDLATRTFVPVTFCPGYARGLSFANGAAIVGLSLARENRTFQGLPLDEALAAKQADARCGLLVIDLASGDISAWARIEGVVRELYDVAFLKGVRQPAAVGFKSDEITRIINIDDHAA